MIKFLLMATVPFLLSGLFLVGMTVSVVGVILLIVG